MKPTKAELKILRDANPNLEAEFKSGWDMACDDVFEIFINGCPTGWSVQICRDDELAPPNGYFCASHWNSHTKVSTSSYFGRSRKAAFAAIAARF